MSAESQIHQYQKHFAIVTRNMDPRLGSGLRGAVFFKSDTLTNGKEYPLPARPNFPIAGKNSEGFFFVPQVGDQIEVEVLTAAEHPDVVYNCMLYSDEDPVPEEFLENYPHRMGWRTRVGHILLFDNKTTTRFIKFYHGIGTGFHWTKDGDEDRLVVRNQIELIKGTVTRTVEKLTTEIFKAEVHRTVHKKLTEIFKNDVFREITGSRNEKVKSDDNLECGANKTIKVTGNCKIEVGGNADIIAGGNAKIDAGGNVDVTAGAMAVIMAPLIHLNGSSSGITTENSHLGVIDLITGAPVIPSTTVFGDI